ncbi:hypothetical protein BJ878DRAFT_513922 [Calycina marina]|uniref:Glutamate carboxypeptidase n=1 Tax=Calycina marina TaxID=1763456 RepID=A0A9P7YZS2_9HELO|nr:hypothetical protein BJ878DRAFT_513922 [Calycina marina]
MPPDEKPYKYEPLAIPTYEEATGTSSRVATPSHNNESAEPEERVGLLGTGDGRLPVPTRRAGFRPSGTDDGRNSTDDLTPIDQPDRVSVDSDEALVRQEIEEMEIEEPPQPQSTWGKRISIISQSLSSMNLPFKLRFEWPKMDANLCIFMARVFAILLVLALLWLLFVSDVFPSVNQRMSGQMFDPESVRIYVQSKVDPERMREQLQRITQNDHLAGTEGDYVLAKYVRDFFSSAGLDDVRMEQFDVYLNYPKAGGRQVELLDATGGVKWTAKIEEDEMYTNPPRQQTQVFHGLSKTGDVTGPLMYANYGKDEDFKRLADAGIDTRGAIALMRAHGGQVTYRKVRAAEMAGFAGCMIYTDPADVGFKKGTVAPKGKYMPEWAVERGAVSQLPWISGDVLTPGYPSVKGEKRISKDNNPALVNIPSIPLSWGDAKSLLQVLKGHGQAGPEAWTGGVPDVEYWTGDTASPKVHLVNQQDEVQQQPIWNVLGKITGVEQAEKSVIIGNHRDAWVYGATDAGSGTAAMLELVTIFGDLLARGWRPLRTIEFASWDGKEYNLIGSTEHVENDIERLREHAYVYLNVDSGVVGSQFSARGSPVFKKSLLRVLDRITDPIHNATLRSLWDKREAYLESPGAQSDYVPFQDMAGTSSIDFGFDGAHPYHSAFDTFEYVDTVGDPGFAYHELLGQFWALLTLEMSDRMVLPFDMEAYSASATQWVMQLENWAALKGATADNWSINPLREAVLEFSSDVRLFEKWEKEWQSTVLANGGFESGAMGARRKSHNNRMANFETHLLDLEEGGGVPNRTQYKHILFAPTIGPGYDEYFPAVRDAINERNWDLARTHVEKAAKILKRASKKLIGNS